MAVREVQRWREEGLALRARLLAERETVLARVAELDAALERLPAAGGASSASVPELVRAALERAGRPLAVAEVRAALPGVAALAIGNALHRLVRRGVAVAAGPKGRQTYRVRVPP